MSALEHPDIQRARIDGIPGLGEYTVLWSGEDVHQQPCEIGVDETQPVVVFTQGENVSFHTFEQSYAMARALMEGASQVEWRNR